MSYRIWFKANGMEEVELPVNPQEVTISYPGNPTNYDVEGLGEIIIPRRTKLATLSFESFFPRERVFQPMTNSEYWHTPDWYVTFFKSIQRSRLPFELTIVRGSEMMPEYDGNGNATYFETNYFDTVMKAVLLDISTTDKGGEPGDVYYNMTLSEYRDASPKTLAELASEKTDDDGNVVEQEMVIVANRPPQTGAIASYTARERVNYDTNPVIYAGQSVEVTGKVFGSPEEHDDEWLKQRAIITQAERVIARVLPPDQANKTHSAYILGMGWVDSRNCQPDYQSNFYRIKSMV